MLRFVRTERALSDVVGGVMATTLKKKRLELELGQRQL